VPLDITKLQNLRNGANGSKTAGCPCCIENGHDHSLDHLIIYADGRFGCIANQGDEAHRARIWALAGDGANGDSTAWESSAPPIEIERTWDVGVLDRLVKDYSYWESRGILAETVIPFRGGVATDGQMKNRFVVPIFNSHEQIVGFTGRTLKKGVTPSWKHLGRTAKWIWGGLDEIEESKRVVLVESIADSFMLRQNGVPETLVLFGAKMSEAILGYLIGANPDQIIVATNRDLKHTVGQDAAAKITRTLKMFFFEEKVKIALPNAEGKKDFGEMDSTEIESWKNSLDTNSNSENIDE